VAGCSSSPAPIPSQGASQPAASGIGTPAPPTPLTGHLAVWHSYGPAGGTAGSAELQGFTRILAWMATTNPGLTIETSYVDPATIHARFEAQSGLGAGPDMFIGPNDELGSEARAGYLTNLTSRIDDTLAGVDDVARSGATVDGKVYMVPESLRALAILYDSTKVATPPTTTDALLAFATAGGRVGVAAGPADGWGFYGAFGGAILDPLTGSCAATANAGVADALGYVRSLVTQPSVLATSFDGTVDAAFLAGHLDLIVGDSTILGDAERARPGLAVAPFPTGPAGPGRPLVTESGWVVNSAVTTFQQALAIAAAQQMVSAPAEQLMDVAPGHIPASTATSLADPLARAFASAIAGGDPWPQAPELARYWGPFGDAWSRAVADDGSPAPEIPQLVAAACAAMDGTASPAASATPSLIPSPIGGAMP
jgi:arabinogalactan oligomer / maltooligosaccharide transport system substrate-binding protein